MSLTPCAREGKKYERSLGASGRRSCGGGLAAAAVAAPEEEEEAAEWGEVGPLGMDGGERGSRAGTAATEGGGMLGCWARLLGRSRGRRVAVRSERARESRQASSPAS